MRRGQVLIRAIKADGKWGNVDVLDLDEESFRVFVIDKLCIFGLVVRSTTYAGEEVVLKERTEDE